MEVPPDATVYQRYSPAEPPEAERAAIPLPQREVPVVVGAVGTELTVAVTSVLMLSQVPLLMAT